MPKTPREVAGFSVLAIKFPSTHAFPQETKHYLYIKPHNPKVADEDASRSLFVVNIPIATTEVHLRHLFGTQLGSGRVEKAHFTDYTPKSKSTLVEGIVKQNKKRKRVSAEELESSLKDHELPPVWTNAAHASGAHAVVVFVDRPSMELSLKAVKKAAKLGSHLVWGEGIEDRLPQLGLQRYFTHNRLQYPSRKELLHNVDEYMTTYQKMEEARSLEQAKKRQLPDEDGFVTVTTGARNSAARKQEAEELLAKQTEKSKGLEDFYRFQMRERRKEQQGEMIRKFEDDKRKVEEMRKRRGKLRPE